MAVAHTAQLQRRFQKAQPGPELPAIALRAAFLSHGAPYAPPSTPPTANRSPISLGAPLHGGFTSPSHHAVDKPVCWTGTSSQLSTGRRLRAGLFTLAYSRKTRPPTPFGATQAPVNMVKKRFIHKKRPALLLLLFKYRYLREQTETPVPRTGDGFDFGAAKRNGGTFVPSPQGAAKPPKGLKGRVQAWGDGCMCHGARAALGGLPMASANFARAGVRYFAAPEGGGTNLWMTLA